MILTSSGIYGVLAFAVSRRTRELAIRIAIGAERGNRIRLVMAHSLRLVLIGATFGTALTFGLSRLVRAAGAGSLYDPPFAGIRDSGGHRDDRGRAGDVDSRPPRAAHRPSLLLRSN